MRMITAFVGLVVGLGLVHVALAADSRPAQQRPAEQTTVLLVEGMT